MFVIVEKRKKKIRADATLKYDCKMWIQAIWVWIEIDIVVPLNFISNRHGLVFECMEQIEMQFQS